MAMYADLYADQGSYFSTVINVGSGGAFDANLTGYTARGKIRKSYTSNTTYDFDTTISNATAGQVTISLNSTVTSTVKAGRYLYDVEIIHTSTGKVTRVVEGQIEFSPGITLQALHTPPVPPVPTTVSLAGVVVASVTGNIPMYWQGGQYDDNPNTTFNSIAFGNNVSRIDAYSFLYCTALNGTLTIPKPVTYIGTYSFAYCENIDAVVFPDTLQYVGTRAFYYCNSIESLTLPASLHTIDTESFDSMDNLTSVTFLGKDVNMVLNTFHNCNNLTSVVLPSELKILGQGAFNNCNNLMSITLPETLVSIKEAALARTGISELHIPNLVTDFGSGILFGCENLIDTSNVSFPPGITYIPEGMFSNCSNLAIFSLPQTITTIGDFAFNNCVSLDGAAFPDSLTTIGEHAFNGCVGLTDITFPDSLSTIGEHAFSNCGQLTSISFTSQNATFYEAENGTLNGTAIIENKINMSGGRSVGNLGVGLNNWVEIGNVYAPTPGTYQIRVRYASGSYDRALSLRVNGNNASIITKNVPYTGGWDVPSTINYVVELQSGSNTIRLYNANTSGNTYAPPVDGISSVNAITIGAYAFIDTNIYTIVIPENVIAVNEYAFAYCGGLTTVYVECDASIVDDNAFIDSPVDTIYYKPGTTGWSDGWNGISTSEWENWPEL